MTKTLRKPVTMLLALCMVFTLAVGACADDITFSGGSATSPVNLTTTNEGIGGGDGGEGTTTPTRMSVTVPTALPMAMSDDGTVVTASDCKITNNSYGAVRVRSVCSLPKELQAKYMEKFRWPENFLVVGGNLVATQDKPRECTRKPPSQER